VVSFSSLWCCSLSCRGSDVSRKPSIGDDPPPSLRDWVTWDFETWQDRLSGAQAALHILLPIAAAAVGMTAFGILFQIAQHGGT
jgi:hypothetical protein